MNDWPKKQRKEKGRSGLQGKLDAKMNEEKECHYRFATTQLSSFESRLFREIADAATAGFPFILKEE